MTAGALIAQVDALRPNQYAAEEKLRWLQRLDGQLRLELLDTHRQNSTIRSCGAAGSTASTDGTVLPPQTEPASLGFGLDEETAYTAETELLAPAPYGEELYTAFLFCQIDLMNAEIDKYNQSAALFAAAWRQLADHINRSRRPKGERRWKL